MNILSNLVKKVLRCKAFFSYSMKRCLKIPTIFQDLQDFQDNTTVILFTNNDHLWPNYSPRQRTGTTGNHLSPRVTLIASVKNEEDNIDNWFGRIYGQTHRPDEIIIVDGGSTDRTHELLKIHSKESQIPIQILSNPGGNIAQGRNLAIQHSVYEIIAVTDFGCLPTFNWLERILEPFMVDREILVSAGIYDPISSGFKSFQNKKLWLWGNLDRISPETYLPPGGSAAFKKNVWREVGGYPEWLTLTGEDTFFDLELKQLGGKWAFVPEAIVEWYAPEKFISYIDKLFKWATGDGEMRIRGPLIWNFAIRSIVGISGTILIMIIPIIFFSSISGQMIYYYSLIIILLVLTGLKIWSNRNYQSLQFLIYKISGRFAQLFGYIFGALRNRNIINERYAKSKGVLVILSGVPIDDTGGGARSTQIALEFLRRNFLVIYLHRFPKYETKDLGLIFSFPNLIVKSLQEVNYKNLLSSLKELIHEKSLIAIIEHPIQEFLPVLDFINKIGGKTIYEKIDAWNTSLGGNWYSQNIESKIINQCQILSATAPILANHLHEITGREVHLIPNAVNSEIFNPARNYKIPNDMPQGTWSGIYIGALWGDWFDWDLLKEIGETFPEAVFPIIGDIREYPSLFPINVHFLGLKKQSELPAYIKFSNVSFVPWKVNATTEATSPIKVYEFISMGCPVVTPSINPLDGIPGVFQSKDKEDFINLLEVKRKYKLNDKDISSFIASNNWEYRIQQILDLIR